jgi:hypothetical protein
MTQYRFEDIDLWIECAREWVKRTGEVPASLLVTFDRMTYSDQKLSIYGHHRFLRYPTLKKAILKAQNDGSFGETDEAPVKDRDTLSTPMQIDHNYR